jgi:DNA-binding MarR family transcriptional regulator
VTYGQSGSGKTFYLLDQLLTVAQTHSVVYAPTEGLYGINNRLEALCDYRGVDLGKLRVYRDTVELMKADAVKEFLKHVRHVDPVLVAFDTLSGCMVGGDENAPRDMGLFVHGCETIIRELDCCVQVAHHKGRKGNNERGHSSLRGAADMMVEIECKGQTVTVKCTKSKDSEHFTTERYTLTPHLESMILKPLDGLNKDQMLILRTVEDNPGIKPTALSAKTNISPASVYRILREFKAKQFVKSENGGCYSITDEGKMKLSTPLSNPVDSEDGFEVEL